MSAFLLPSNSAQFKLKVFPQFEPCAHKNVWTSGWPFLWLLLLMEEPWLSGLPLTCSLCLHRAMTLLCQDKVKDHSKPCPGCALLLIKQACMVPIVSAGMYAEIRGGVSRGRCRRCERRQRGSILAATLICSLSLTMKAGDGGISQVTFPLICCLVDLLFTSEPEIKSAFFPPPPHTSQMNFSWHTGTWKD